VEYQFSTFVNLNGQQMHGSVCASVEEFKLKPYAWFPSSRNVRNVRNVGNVGNIGNVRTYRT